MAGMLDWRWAGVLIVGTAVGGATLVLTTSWIASACSAILGAAILSCLFYVPPDPQWARVFSQYQSRLADVDAQRTAIREQIAQLSAHLATYQSAQGQWANCLRQLEQSRQYRLQQLLGRNWKAMRGGDLEQFLAHVLSELQYTVDQTGGAGDQGVDLVASKDGHRIAVQVKGYLDTVPNTAIQEAFTGMAFHRCEACAVITNSRFTSAAQKIAETIGCVLIDEDAMPMFVLGQLDLWQQVLLARAKLQPNAARHGAHAPLDADVPMRGGAP